jgi:hypothetical protein
MAPKILVLGIVGIVILATAASPDDAKSIAIVGKNVDASDGKTFRLVLVLSGHPWSVSEPGGGSHFFKTKTGTWLRVDEVVNLLDARRRRVGRLDNLIPESAKPGQQGRGYAAETGIAFNWEVR